MRKLSVITWRAVHRLPGRIYPYYLLVKLYAEKDFYQPDKLYRAARICAWQGAESKFGSGQADER